MSQWQITHLFPKRTQGFTTWGYGHVKLISFHSASPPHRGKISRYDLRAPEEHL